MLCCVCHIQLLWHYQLQQQHPHLLTLVGILEGKCCEGGLQEDGQGRGCVDLTADLGNEDEVSFFISYLRKKHEKHVNT